MIKQSDFKEKDLVDFIKSNLGEIPAPANTVFCVAGGAVANLIWNYFTGNDAPINDIDVYLQAPQSMVDNYRTEKGIEEGDYEELGIVKRESNGIYDLIWIARSTETVIYSFDINCTQAMWQGGEITVSPEFIEFLNTRQIKIVEIRSIKTLMRAHKKSLDIVGAYWDEEQQIEFVSRWNQVLGPIPMTVSPDTHERYSEQMARYLNLHLDTYNDNLQKLMDWRGDDITKLFYEYKSGTNHLRKVVNAFVEKATKSIVRQMSSNLTSYTKGAPISRIKTVCEFLEKHHEVHMGLWRVPFRTVANVVSELKKLERKYGMFIYGMFRSKYVKDGSITSDFEHDIKKYFEQHQGVLAKPLPEFRFEDVLVRELLTLKDLGKEASIMHHCVHGYAGRIKDGNVRVLSIVNKDNPAIRSTVSIMPWGSRWFLNQVLTYTNAPAPSRHVDVANIIVQLLDKEGTKHEEDFIVSFDIAPGHTTVSLCPTPVC